MSKETLFINLAYAYQAAIDNENDFVVSDLKNILHKEMRRLNKNRKKMVKEELTVDPNDVNAA